MQKATIFLIIVIGFILSALAFFVFQPLGLFLPLNSSCASLTIDHISEYDLQQIANKPEYKTIMTFSDMDLKEVPKLSQLIQKVSNKAELNTGQQITVTNSEAAQYYSFLSEKFERQY